MDSIGLNYPFISPFFIKTWLLSAVFSGMGHALSSHCHHFNLDSHAALDVIGHRRQHEAGLVALDPQVTRLGDAIMLLEDAEHALDGAADARPLAVLVFLPVVVAGFAVLGVLAVLAFARAALFGFDDGGINNADFASLDIQPLGRQLPVDLGMNAGHLLLYRLPINQLVNTVQRFQGHMVLDKGVA